MSTDVKPIVVANKIKSTIEKHKNTIRKLSYRLEDIENSKILPSVKKKYEGTFWKYNNGYNLNQRWWMYVLCVRVKSVDSFVVNTFEVTPSEFEFKLKDVTFGTHLFQTKITKSEYDSELKKFIKQAEKLAHNQ